MASREGQQKVREKKLINYSAESPKDISEESVEDMLASVDQFIEGVYRDLSITPPKRSSIGTSTTVRTIVDEESSSSSQNSSPVGISQLPASTFTIGSTSICSLPMRRNMDMEIEKINRICDNVDQNLRSIGLIMNNCSDNRTSDDLLNTNLRSTPSPSTSVIVLNSTNYNMQNSPPQVRTSSPIRQVSAPVIDLLNLQTQTPELIRQPVLRSTPSPSTFEPTLNSTSFNMQNNPPQVPTSSPTRQVSEPVIDLSNSQTQTHELIRQPVRHNNDDDDDVILVSAYIPSVVDLCSPDNHQEMPLVSSSTNYRPLNRRRLLDNDDPDVVDTCCKGPSSIRRRLTEPSYTTPPQNKPSEKSVTNDAGRVPYMCPVCMESCLQRQPTSTICGHVFCKECVERAISLTHKCPMCNKKISRKHTFRIYL